MLSIRMAHHINNPNVIRSADLKYNFGAILSLSPNSNPNHNS